MRIKDLKQILEQYNDDMLVCFTRYGAHHIILNHVSTGDMVELSGVDLQPLLKNMELFLEQEDSDVLLRYCEDLYLKHKISKPLLIYCLQTLAQWHTTDEPNKEESIIDVLNALCDYSPAHYKFPFICVPCFLTEQELNQ